MSFNFNIMISICKFPDNLKLADIIHSYEININISNRFQRVRVNAAFSSWSEINYGVPHG